MRIVPRFFINGDIGNSAVIPGEDARHISKSLRMHAGDMLTLSGGKGIDYGCVIEKIEKDAVTVKVLYSQPSEVEPSVKVTLFQGLPKGEKFDLIIQKAVELGVSKIVPMLTDRCVSRPDGDAEQRKHERWQKIASEAAKQCGRGIIPEVVPLCSFDYALKLMKQPLKIIFYEGGGRSLRKILTESHDKDIAVMIGPEGGFESREVGEAEKLGAVKATLGPRILRTETAPIAAVSAIMYETGNLE